MHISFDASRCSSRGAWCAESVSRRSNLTATAVVCDAAPVTAFINNLVHQQSFAGTTRASRLRRERGLRDGNPADIS
jgi:hypothetical protein